MLFRVPERFQKFLPTVPAAVTSITESMGFIANLWPTALLSSVWSAFLSLYYQAFSTAALLLFRRGNKGKHEQILRFLYLGTGEDGGTFRYDDTLPPLPLPPLHDILQAYLESCKPHLENEEIEKLSTTLNEFENGIGADLHATLRERAASTGNWLEKWWEEEVYLKARQPLIPWNQMCSVEPVPEQRADDYDFLTIALRIHFLIEFWRLLRRQRIKPQVQAGKNGGKPTPFSMHQFRRFYNTCRIPKEGVDIIANYFTTEEETGKDCPNHIVVMYRGFLYSLQVADLETDELASPVDLARSARWILNDARSRSSNHGPGIASLTCDDRDNWAANRQRLINLDPRNAELLREIESSLVAWSLRDETPQDQTELFKAILTGAGFRDNWADKSSTLIQFRNGLNGCASDHTPLDGMVHASIGFYVLQSVAMLDGKWPADRQSNKVWPNPTRLDFVIDKKIEEDISRIQHNSKTWTTLIDCKLGHFREFGKAVLKVHRTHPDAFVQAAIQLTYFRLHRKTGSTYETASTRKFFHGRTDTCRACTLELTNFTRVMDDMKVDGPTKWQLFKDALRSHQTLMWKAQDGGGCDRSMFGLQLVARELGVDDPLLREVFGPGPFTKSGGNGNFVLSTSLLGYSILVGGMIPMCPDGYGVFYTIEDNVIHYTVSNWTGHETDSKKFSETFEQSLRDLNLLAATHHRP